MRTILQLIFKDSQAVCHRATVGGLVLTLLVAPACGSDPPMYLDGVVAIDGGGPGASSGMEAGLPCDVNLVLQTHCLRCHGSPPAGAPIALASAHDLQAASQVDPTKKVAERAVLRMQDPSRPMPPGNGPTVSAAEVAVVQSWIVAGMPQGGCSSMPPSTTLSCTSGQTWNDGNSKSPLMHPGDSCIACHTTMGRPAPSFVVAGTVYPSAHEPTDCLGADGMLNGTTIELTDAAGKVFTLPVNSSGNFMYALKQSKLRLPYRAKVKQGGRERLMGMAQMIGDCNSCHTPLGSNGAPGRIQTP